MLHAIFYSFLQILSPFFTGSTATTPAAPPAGMSLWYSADCITYTSSVCGVPSNGSTITAWADRSGNANDGLRQNGTFTFNTNQVNSQPAVTLSVAGMNLTNAIPASGGGAWTAFAVYNVGSGNSLSWTDSVGSSQGSFQWVNNQGSNQTVNSSDFAAIGHGSITIAASTWYQSNVQFRNNVSGFILNFRLAKTIDTLVPQTTTSNILQPNGSIFWSPRDGPTSGSTGQVAEFIMYNSLLTSPQITQVETYFTNKYGI